MKFPDQRKIIRKTNPIDLLSVDGISLMYNDSCNHLLAGRQWKVSSGRCQVLDLAANNMDNPCHVHTSPLDHSPSDDNQWGQCTDICTRTVFYPHDSQCVLVAFYDPI